MLSSWFPQNSEAVASWIRFFMAIHVKKLGREPIYINSFLCVYFIHVLPSGGPIEFHTLYN